jgi:hypothetical protein
MAFSSRADVSCYHMLWNSSLVIDGVNLPTTGESVETPSEPTESQYSLPCTTGPGETCVKVS